MRKYLLIFLPPLFFMVSAAFAQSRYTDSLKNKLLTAKADINKVNIYDDLTYYYIWSYPDSALVYQKAGLKLAQKLGYLRGQLDGVPDLLVANYKATQAVAPATKTIYHYAGYNTLAELYNNKAVKGKSVISFYINKPAGDGQTTDSFSAGDDIETGLNPVAIETGDIKGDGGLEVAVSNFGGNSISIFRYKAKTIAPVVQAAVNTLLVHNAVSPNGDGINDVLTIDGIQNYPNNKVMIMNVNGEKIFEVAGYDNVSKVFNGHSSISNQMLKPGTYFYLVEYKSAGQQRQQTGYIVLKY